MPKIASVSIDVKLNLDPAKRQVTEFGHSGGRIAGGQFERGFSDHLRSATPRINSVMTGVFQGVGIQLAQIGLDAGKKFGDAFSSSIATSVNFEKLNRTLQVVTGSTTAAARELAYVGEVTKRLSLPIEETTRGYIQMTAAAKGTILEGEGVRQIFTGIAAASKTLGLSSAETSRALNAVQQMISKGKISAEELRQQLGEVMPGAFQQFAKSLGVSTQELDKLLEDGKVGIDSLIYFAAQLNKEFGHTAEAY
ncbi:MAG: hypothetical protein N4J56_002854 [Chroococcidiopsis sp. SAG 2025]|uniref:tape measure protein n=1 Tax=Chroococcidiopsis sp. SAG 2025 TaxID=171389 RepID=UPI002936F2CC|nr:tape measure protein [Chroococcidiopsis sp. SAG 2025]MDV2993200.1 hypothetical protein [Chroococcidiopsis sp. SAG 2025]